MSVTAGPGYFMETLKNRGNHGSRFVIAVRSEANPDPCVTQLLADFYID